MSFIVFEGCDLSGKSEQARRLAESLKKKGIDCLLSREPGGTEQGESLRQLLGGQLLGGQLLGGQLLGGQLLGGQLLGARPLAGNHRWSDLGKALLFYAARAEHIKLLRGQSKAGRWLILDRFYLSTTVYQRRAGKSLLESLKNAVVGDFEPDLWIILDAPFAALTRRRQTRVEDDLQHYEKNNRADWEALRGEYLRLAATMPNAVVVDAARTEEQVAAAVRGVIKDKLGVEL